MQLDGLQELMMKNNGCTSLLSCYPAERNHYFYHIYGFFVLPNVEHAFLISFTIT